MPFDGRIPDTNIVVDNCAARYPDCYFLLTHSHTDHTKGLTANFTKGAIHCSKLCKELLLMKYPSIAQHNPIIGHEIGSSFTLSNIQSPERRGLKKKRYKNKNRNKNTHNSFNTNSNNSNETDDIDSEDEWRNAKSNGVEITLIDANHCPGSVMFLIRNTKGKVYLHTGDYRTSDGMINKLSNLCSNIWIDIVYMDVTFCHPSSIFPSKKAIARQTINYINAKRKDKQWRKTNNMSFKIIYIEAKQLGVEPFLIEMCKGLKTKMWADPRRLQYKYLMHFPETRQYMTLDKNEAKIHIPSTLFSSFVSEDKKYRKENKLPNVMYISPTTMYFVMRNYCNVPITVSKNDGITHVLYSMHCGYDEMRKLISKLNVKQVMPFHEPFIRERWPNFDAVRYVRSHFKDCIESDPTESKDIFVPNLNSDSNSMDVDTNNTNNNKNTLMCMATALNRDAQDDKFLKLRNMVRKNKHKLTQNMDNKSPPKRMNTAPMVSINRHGGKSQDGWVNSMTRIKNVTESNKLSPPKIKKSVSEVTPILPKRRNRKRKFMDDIIENDNDNYNENTCKKRKIASHTANKNRNTQYESRHVNNIISTPIQIINEMSYSSSNGSPILSGTLSCERRGLSGKYKTSSPLKMPNLRGSYSSDSNNTFDEMDMDDIDDLDDHDNGDDDAKMVILEDDITPGNIHINDDESTINEELETQTNEDIFDSYLPDGIHGERQPFFISRRWVKGRRFMIYESNKWDTNKLNELLNVMRILKMKQVYTVHNTKYIVVDLDVTKEDDFELDLRYKMGYEIYSGYNTKKEVWDYKIFECVIKSENEKGIKNTNVNGVLNDYCLMTSMDVSSTYLMKIHLWPPKEKRKWTPNS